MANDVLLPCALSDSLLSITLRHLGLPMNKREYVEHLEEVNGSCGCGSLSELFRLRDEADVFIAKCDFFKRNVCLEEPEPTDRKILCDYRYAVESMNKKVNEYYRELTRLAGCGLVCFWRHDGRRFRPVRKLSCEEARKLCCSAERIITMHCSSCGQQFDLAATEDSGHDIREE